VCPYSSVATQHFDYPLVGKLIASDALQQLYSSFNACGCVCAGACVAGVWDRRLEKQDFEIFSNTDQQHRSEQTARGNKALSAKQLAGERGVQRFKAARSWRLANRLED